MASEERDVKDERPETLGEGGDDEVCLSGVAMLDPAPLSPASLGARPSHYHILCSC